MLLKTETKLQAGIWKEGYRKDIKHCRQSNSKHIIFYLWHWKGALQCLWVPACLLFIFKFVLFAN